MKTLKAFVSWISGITGLEGRGEAISLQAAIDAVKVLNRKHPAILHTVDILAKLEDVTVEWISNTPNGFTGRIGCVYNRYDEGYFIHSNLGKCQVIRCTDGYFYAEKEEEVEVTIALTIEQLAEFLTLHHII